MKLVQQGIRFSQEEIKHLGYAIFGIAIVFTIAFSRSGSALSLPQLFVMSLIAVGTGFLFHEMAHKFVAQNYGCAAEFRSAPGMLLIAMLIAFTGFVFIAPGAVLIHGTVTRRRNGLISAAGPLMNILLSAVFLVLAVLIQAPFLAQVFAFGSRINAWLAVFNMIPFGNFDGAKVLHWDKKVYAGLVILAFVAFLVTTI